MLLIFLILNNIFRYLFPVVKKRFILSNVIDTWQAKKLLSKVLRTKYLLNVAKLGDLLLPRVKKSIVVRPSLRHLLFFFNQA